MEAKKNARGVHGQTHQGNANSSFVEHCTTKYPVASALIGFAAFWAVLQLVIFPLLYQWAAYVHGWC